MYKQSVIYFDSAGYPNRAKRIASICAKLGIPFLYGTPEDVGVEGATPVSIPVEFLPKDAELSDNRGIYEWFRMHMHLSLCSKLLPDSEFYWMIEADVDGPNQAFERLFTQTLDQSEDAIWPRLMHKKDNPNHPALAYFDSWYDVCSFNCIMRASKAAIHVWDTTAEETREIYTEVAAPSTIKRAGLSIGLINRPGKPSLYHTGTLMFNPGRSSIEPCHSDTLLRHPVKRDDIM
jgi:hypothetical protein